MPSEVAGGRSTGATGEALAWAASELSPADSSDAADGGEKLLEAARTAGWPAFDLLGWGPIGGSEALWRHFVDRAAADGKWVARAFAVLALWLEIQPETKWAERRFREAQKAIPIAWGSRPKGSLGWKNSRPPSRQERADR